MYEIKTFLLNFGIIAAFILCDSCGNECIMPSLNEGNNEIVYKCKKSIAKKSSLFRSTVPLTKIVHLIYFLLLDINYNKLSHFYFIADSTI